MICPPAEAVIQGSFLKVKHLLFPICPIGISFRKETDARGEPLAFAALGDRYGIF